MPEGQDRSQPPGINFNQSWFTTRSARPFSPSTMFSFLPAAIFSRNYSSWSRMSVGLPSSTLAVLVGHYISV